MCLGEAPELEPEQPQLSDTFMVGKRVKWGFPGGSDGKKICLQCRRQIPSLGLEDPLEKGMATHSSILAWNVPWTEEPGGL